MRSLPWVSLALSPLLLLPVAASPSPMPSGSAVAYSAPVDNALMPSPPALGYTCRRIDARLVHAGVRWRIACPTRVPDSQVLFVIAYNGGALAANDFGAGYMIAVGGSGPLAGASGGHWVIVGGNAKRLHDALVLASNAVGKPTVAETSSRAVVSGQPVRIYRESNAGMSLYSGHVVVEWTQKGQGWQVSIHGWQHERQALAMARVLIRQIARMT